MDYEYVVTAPSGYEITRLPACEDLFERIQLLRNEYYYPLTITRVKKEKVACGGQSSSSEAPGSG